MRDVQRPPGTKRWRFRVKDPATGRWRYETVPEEISSKTAAREYMRAHLTSIARQEVGLEEKDPNPNRWNVWQLTEWWLEHFVDGRLASGVSVRGRCVKHLMKARLGRSLIDRVQSEEVERWLHSVEGALSAQTVNHLRSHLSRAFNVAIKQGHFNGPNPVKLVDKRALTNFSTEYLSKPEVRQVLEIAELLQPQYAALYATAFYTGLRKGELFALRWTDVDLEHGHITVRRSHERSTTKSKKSRTVFIPAELRPWLEEQRERGDTHVFPARGGGQLGRMLRIDTRFRRVTEAAGIDRHLRFHDTRHTFASLFLMGGGDIVVLQELLGHASIETTRKRYGHLSRAHVRAQHAAFSMADGPTTPGSPRPDAISAPDGQ